MRLSALLSLLIFVQAPAQHGPDLNEVLKRADKVLDESKAAYEEARAKNSAGAYVMAAFKLEEARIKYIVLQDRGTAELQTLAAERLRTVNQLRKLIQDGKGAVPGGPADAAPATDEKPFPKVSVKLPIPEAAKQQAAEKKIRQMFKAEYAKKEASDRQALARALLEWAGKSAGDPAALWVHCREAQDVATQACDVKTALQAFDLAAAAFDMDVLPMKSSLLHGLAGNAKNPDESFAVARALLQFAEDCVEVDQYELAEKALLVATLHAGKGKDPNQAARAATRSNEVAAARTRYQALKNVFETLARTPEDPAANNEMGQFLCFIKGDWDLGLRFLVRGSDATLRALAQKDLSFPAQAAELAALGDGWWDLLEKDPSPLRRAQIQAHARRIYEEALRTAPLAIQTKIEKRLAAAEPPPGPSTTVNLMKAIDVAKDVVAGAWTLKGGKLTCDAKDVARIEIPYEPPAEYDFRITFSRKEGSGEVLQILTKGSIAFHWVMGSGPKGLMGFALINGHAVTDPGSPGAAAKPLALANGNTTYTSLVQVRKDGVKAFLDGKLVKEFKTTSYEEMSVNPLFKIRSTSILGLGSWYSSVSYDRIEVVEITGKGKPTR